MSTDFAWFVWGIVSLLWVFAAAAALGVVASQMELSTFDKRFCWATLIFGVVWVLPVAIRVWAMVVAA